MPQRKLFAVLCAVNEYKWPVSPLKGCVNDALEWKTLLSEQSDAFDIEITELLNDKAVKASVISALETALDNASENDVVFFYYSGHGTREASHDVFSEIDSDGAFETLVCYDGITHDGELFHFNLISDKELHYVISTNSKPGVHIVLAMDSCHSGNITRNAFNVESETVKKRQFMPPSDAKARLSMTAPRREWSDFIFGEKISAAKIDAEGWFELVPQKPHVAMSACLNDESAFEVDGHGIFTTNLIKVLRRTQCEISYRSLQTRVRQFVRNQQNQTPEIFATQDNAEDLLLNFLSKEGPSRPYRANCFYSKNKEWTIDLGSVHGLNARSGPVVIETGDGNISVELDSIESNLTTLRLSTDQLAKLDTQNAYDASVVNYMNGGTSFYVKISENSELGETVKQELKRSTASGSSVFSTTLEKSEAQYLIDVNSECITITQNSSEEYPVWRVVFDERAIGRLVRAMGHIAKWEYVKSYDNPDVNPSDKYPVELFMEVTRPNGQTAEMPIEKNRIIVKYEKGLTMRIRLDNTSEHKYFCALLYMSNTFEIEGGLVDGKVKGIQAGTSEWILNGRKIPVTMEEHVLEFEMPASLSYIKLIANEKIFDVEAMEQSGLPAPRQKCSDNKRGAGTQRGLAIDRGVDKIVWFTRTIELMVLNPEL